MKIKFTKKYIIIAAALVLVIITSLFIWLAMDGKSNNAGKIEVSSTVASAVISKTDMASTVSQKGGEKAESKAGNTAAQSSVTTNKEKTEITSSKAAINSTSSVNSTAKTKESNVSKASTVQKLDFEQMLTIVKKYMADKKIPITYKSGISNPATASIEVATTKTTKQTAAEIYDEILNIFDYNSYLESITNSAASATPFDYSYNITNSGKSADGKNNIFIVSYILNKQFFKNDIFNSDSVIKSAAELITNSEKISVKRDSGLSQNSTAISISDIPAFYSTDEVAEYIARSAERQIKGQNLSGASYTKFNLLYFSKNDASFTFILLLG